MIEPTIHSITATAARQWYRQHFSGAFPAGCVWLFVEGVQFAPKDRASFLVSGDEGMCGIIAVRMKQAAKGERVA
jgi:hypothetical protein